jgi:hypothetical protein
MKKPKIIILTEQNDPTLFKQYGKYHIFDKKIVIQQSVNELSDQRTILNYVKNTIIERELNKAIKNKKIDCLVYLLQGSDAKNVEERILAMCAVAPIKNTIEVTIVFL